jgi:branched-chain amino acid transport system substrate-binding protein
MDKLAAKHGFEVIKIAVAHPGNEQQSQWLQIRQAKPDYVVLWGWGVMNPTAIKAAAKTGFPREKLIGVWWSGAEEDTIPAGTAAKGFIAAGFNVAGANYLVGPTSAKHVRQEQGQHGRQDPRRFGVLQPRRGVRHHHRRGDPQGPGKVRQGQGPDRRADPLGLREPQPG